MPPSQESKDFGQSTQQFDAALTREALPSGTRLGGYQIIDVLGRGSFGIVYLALDASLQRQVAIKEYLPTDLATRSGSPQLTLKPGTDPAAYAAGLGTFLNEAKLLARFDHPSLARVHSFWEENGTAYMVMPYYHGHTLAATLKAMPQPPDEAWLRGLLTPLLSALNVLHAAQCYHRDISPDNIFVLADGRPVLLDFGAANRVAGDKTMPLTALLNPAYAPIEQYNESATLPQGPWTDLYALAGVLHFAITGQPPARATVRAIDDTQRPLSETVQALRATVPGPSYSEAFLAGIDKALSVKPRDRPRNAADFQQWLDRVQPAADAASPVAPAPAEASSRHEPIFAVSSVREEWSGADGPPHLGRPARNRAPLWIAALGALALAAVGGWWWTQQMPGAAPQVTAAAEPAASATVPVPLPASAAITNEVAASSATPAEPAASQTMPAASSPAVAANESAATPAASAPATAAPVAEPPASAVAVAAPPAAVEPPAEPASARKAGKPAVAAEPDNPRAVCGPRANFSLYYCMQTQCKRPKFAQHPQCVELQRRGEVS